MLHVESVCVCVGGGGCVLTKVEKILKILFQSSRILILSVVIKRAASTCLSALFLSLSVAHFSSSSTSSAPFM